MNPCINPAAPDLRSGLIAAGVFVIVGAIVAYLVRPMLRDPLVPRRLSIVIIISACMLGFYLTRRVASGAEYHGNFREGDWVLVWVLTWMVTFMYVLFWRNHILGIDHGDAPAPAQVAAADAAKRIAKGAYDAGTAHRPD